MRYPFEVDADELKANIDSFVSVVFESLESEFLTLPRGVGFVEYIPFEDAYEVLKRSTDGFSSFEPARVLRAIDENLLVFVVMRTMLGLTPPEWAHLASLHGEVSVSQNWARSFDRRARLGTVQISRRSAKLEVMVDAACRLLSASVPDVSPAFVHRLDKADTHSGTASLRHVAQMGVPYAMLLYERLLGRPFAGHRDSVSELVGGRLENAVENILTRRGIGYRKTQRAERLPGFDQAPDFVIPDEYNPVAVIEAKLTEDDGTARDKVTRIQHLAQLSTTVVQ